MIKRTERGWIGHFICGSRCKFRRNTLLEYDDIKIVVSTVGNLWLSRDDSEPETVGCGRYYETMAFHSNKNDTIYHDADTTNQVDFDSEWSIDYYDTEDVDNVANDMHETVVSEITDKLLQGDKFIKEVII